MLKGELGCKAIDSIRFFSFVTRYSIANLEIGVPSASDLYSGHITSELLKIVIGLWYNSSHVSH
jgi:hypothetical protein